MIYFLAFCFWAPLVWAGGELPPSNIEKAAQLYEEAESNYKLQKYREALSGFEEAYRLTQEPQLLFNLGQCYRQLNRLDDARKAFETFLRDAPANSPLRATAKERLSEVNTELIRLASKSSLQISSSQDPARVFLDGEPKGHSPLTLHGVEPGAHQIILKKEGFSPYELKTELAPGQVLTLDAPLEPLGRKALPKGVKTLYLSAAGSGAAALLSFGGAFLMAREAQERQLENQEVEDFIALQQRAERLALLSEGLFGAALLVGSVGLVLQIKSQKADLSFSARGGISVAVESSR